MRLATATDVSSTFQDTILFPTRSRDYGKWRWRGRVESCMRSFPSSSVSVALHCLVARKIWVSFTLMPITGTSLRCIVTAIWLVPGNFGSNNCDHNILPTHAQQVFAHSKSKLGTFSDLLLTGSKGREPSLPVASALFSCIPFSSQPSPLPARLPTLLRSMTMSASKPVRF